MAKKVVAALRSVDGAQFVRVVKMVKSPKTGAYAFREEIVAKDASNNYFSKK
ncbi:MAG: DUF4295 domain-containing protein [Bacteroidetes bacterium]|nr:DUF4295 domain-containing protein [Bacteroidota bacterium]MBU1718840.1 DUF4295 domain-containing protein [Bacteroidota bacterium]